MTRTVLDKHGTQYQLEPHYGEHGTRINLRYHHQAVGYANIFHQGPRQWEIADLLIENNSIIPRPLFIVNIRDLLLKLEPKRRNFRGLGLGNVLLQSIIGEAREYGVQNISATLSHKDRQESPFLVQWCAKNGFREVSRKPGHPRNCEVQMEINL